MKNWRKLAEDTFQSSKTGEVAQIDMCRNSNKYEAYSLPMKGKRIIISKRCLTLTNAKADLKLYMKNK